MTSFTIRPFATIDEYRACADLQEDTWGKGFSERVSPAILKVAQILGGVSAGAWDDEGRLVGFVFGMTGQRDGELVHWSDMLAVRPELRDSGLGRQLKAYQREDVLSRGVEKMFWTFDPLRSRNAHLNITRLGAVVREYHENMYGDTDSPLHKGIGTDRMVALWQLPTDRVAERVAAFSAPGPSPVIPFADGPSALAAAMDGAHPRPAEPDTTLGNDFVHVAIPSDIGTLMSDDLGLAVAWREATRAVFHHYLSSGYEVREFQRGTPVSTYLLARLSG